MPGVTEELDPRVRLEREIRRQHNGSRYDYSYCPRRNVWGDAAKDVENRFKKNDELMMIISSAYRGNDNPDYKRIGEDIADIYEVAIESVLDSVKFNLKEEILNSQGMNDGN